MAGGIYHVSCSDANTTAWTNWTTSCYSYSSNATGDCTSSTTSSASVWTGWVGDWYGNSPTVSQATITYVDGAAWFRWVEGSWDVAKQPTEEELAAIQEQQERQRQAYEESRRLQAAAQAEAQRKREEAESVAVELLMELIGPVEAEVYKKTGRLFVKGERHDYMIHRNRESAGANVTRIEKDKLVDLCVHLPSYREWCETDNVIALKMAIEADEQNFRGNVIMSKPRPKELPLAANG